MATATGDPIESQIEDAVGPLCERYGCGAVMETAARLWQERDPMGALGIDDGRVADALLDYEIGASAALDRLPVDWAYVAERMARALYGRSSDRDGPRA